jgi:hypothetical protein
MNLTPQGKPSPPRGEGFSIHIFLGVLRVRGGERTFRSRGKRLKFTLRNGYHGFSSEVHHCSWGKLGKERNS